MNTKTKVAVLIGGNGSNLQALLNYAAKPEARFEISMVISHNPQAFGLTRAKNANVPRYCVDAKTLADRSMFDAALIEIIDAHKIDVIALAGFMRILSDRFVQHYENKIINIHPSLLPKYKGLDTHQRVRDAGDVIHGCTLHKVISELDSGPNIAQCTIDIYPNDTIDTLKHRVHQAEHQLYPMVLQWLAEGRLTCQNDTLLFDNVVLPSEGIQLTFNTLK